MATVLADWKWLITAAIAFYAAGLSTFSAYTARKQNRRQINVTTSYGFLTFGPDLSDQMLIVTASNPGQRAVTLTSVLFLLPNGKQALINDKTGSHALPHHLTEGTSVKHWIPVKEMAALLRQNGFSGKVKIRAFYNDAVDERHYDKPLTFDIDD